jgi:hypothetical protein
LRRIALLATVFLGTAFATGDAPVLAIRGYDPVAYFTLQRATLGLPNLTYEWDEHLWRFASAQHRDLFRQNPVRYAPQFASFCAIALARGELLEANPEFWLISDGQLYLFGKPFGPDRFRAHLRENIESANRNRALLPKSQRVGE